MYTRFALSKHTPDRTCTCTIEYAWWLTLLRVMEMLYYEYRWISSIHNARRYMVKIRWTNLKHKSLPAISERTSGRINKLEKLGHTSVIPIPYCPKDIRYASWATSRYSGNGKRAALIIVISDNEDLNSNDSERVHTLQIPQAALHSSEVADTWFAWQSIPAAANASRPVGVCWNHYATERWRYWKKYETCCEPT